MTITATDIRRMSFDAIETEVLSEDDRWVLSWTLGRAIWGEDLYFWTPARGDAFRRLCRLGLFYHRPGADPSHRLTTWKLTRMGAALAHRIRASEAALAA